MAQMIDDLLHLSRATRVELRRGRVDLTELAEGAVAELRDAEPDRDTRIVIPPGLVTTGDAHLLRLVLVNLLTNAWKFTAKQSPAIIQLGASIEAGETVYYIRDNGVGFDMAYAVKLFEPFQRLHSRNDFDGSGLGLAIVQRIIRRHGGRIWADGKPGAGACFWFTVRPPRADDQ
jgi:signal transduction histidine kinase